MAEEIERPVFLETNPSELVVMESDVVLGAIVVCY